MEQTDIKTVPSEDLGIMLIELYERITQNRNTIITINQELSRRIRERPEAPDVQS